MQLVMGKIIMKKKKIFLILALLCTVAQGAWATIWNEPDMSGAWKDVDVWDGKTRTKPQSWEFLNHDLIVVYINTAAELAYVNSHWNTVDNYDGWGITWGDDTRIKLNVDLDMTASTWNPFGRVNGEILPYRRTFDGQGHTLRIKIDNGTSENYQGLFAQLNGIVKNLHLDCYIKVGNARMVAGICGENNGIIENCWVSGHIESDHYSAHDAELGGIAGINENDGAIKYCCVTADVKNTDGNFGVGGIAGSNDGSIQHVTFTGSVSVDHDQDNKYVGDQDGKLENNYDSYNESEYSAASGNDLYRCAIKYPSLSNLYIIDSTDKWNEFNAFLYNGFNFSGKTVKLSRDISITTMLGRSLHKSFSGTFDGDGHTITATIDQWGKGVSPFRYINGATIKNLIVAGSIIAHDLHPSGLVGFSYGTGNRVENCIVTANIERNEEWYDKYIGGLVGHALSSDIAVSGCVFSGKMTNNATERRRTIKGALIGWSDKGGTKSVADCLYAMQDDQDQKDLDLVKGGEDVTVTNCYKTTNAGSLGTRAVVFGNAPDELGALVKDYGLVKAYTNGIQYNGKYYLDANLSFSGSGTEAAPYIIGNTDDWNNFASNVNVGANYSGLFVKLTSDISVSTMAGTDETNSFQGTFDGDGNKLTFTKGSATEAFGEDNCAPFRYTNGATIRNLKVAGNIYTAKKFGAGLISRSYGTTNITGCQVSTVIHSSINGDGTHGGLVALPGGSLTIKDCIFDGRLLTSNGTDRCGGFVGWHNGQSISITNAFYAPNTTALSGSSDETDINDGATFVRGASAGSNCYYTEPLGEAQGRQVFTTLPDGELCLQAEAADGKTYYLPCLVSGIKPSYDLEDGVSITPTVTGLDDATLTFGTDYTATLNGNAVDQLPITITTDGEHTLTFTGKSANYIGSKSITVIVTPALEGDGTAEKPYLIHSVKDWNLLATNVADGRNYSGQFVKLMADIDITQPVGVREGKPFSGTFLGDGHTLTADIRNDTEEQGAAPFRYIKNATIQNLTVAGTIASSSYHTAGLVGFAEGTNLIENCTVSATLNISSNYAGGIVGHGLTSSTTLRGCIFAGAVKGINGDFANIGGLWGWSDSGAPVLENCLEKGTYTAIVSMHPMGLQGNKGTITGCYYMNAQIGSPANACTVKGAYQVATTNTGGEVYMPVTAIDGNTYYAVCTVSNMVTLYLYTGSDIKVELPTVTSTDGTVLTPGTDFTYSPETVREKGDYTLTISGRGIYSGTKTMPFSVTEDKFITPEMTILSSGDYIVFEDVTVNDRITISGDVVLNLGRDTKLTIPKGIELSKGNTLTINGPGALSIEKVDDDNAGIGAVEVGTLVINGGTIKVTGGKYGAGLGGSRNNVSGGSITINGGVLNILSSGIVYAAPIGGGYDDKPGQYGVCGDIVINGGQVTAAALLNSNYGPGRQVNDQIYSSGTLTLGWTNPDDFIYMGLNTTVESTYLNSLTFAEGKQFLLRNTTTIAAPGNMAAEYIVPLMALANTGDNSSQVDDYDGMKLPVALLDRTLYKDGTWNTLCLPFNVTISGSPLDGAVARPLTSASISGSTLSLTFGDAVDELVAGTPYIIKWAKANDYVDDDAHNIVSPIFSAVTIDKTERGYDNGTSGDLRVHFLGTYASQSFTATDNSILLMGDDDKLYYPANGASIGAQRAYFRIGEDGAAARRVTAFNVNFDDGETTGVTTTSYTNFTNSDDTWYTLDGRKLQGKPSRAGVYIYNGKTFIIK